MKRYPIGIQTFSEIITENYLYIDKTEEVYNMVTSGKYFFLARPRRFGKSLLVSTLNSLFSGKKELFKGLWIEDKWDWSNMHPIIYIPFNGLDYRGLGLENVVSDCLRGQIEEQGLSVEGDSASKIFKNFIEEAHKKTGKKVVILIDEYDKSLIDFLEDPEQLEANRNFLKSFYGVLKPADPYLELVFLTGVSHFSKVSIFSDLNNIQDITLHESFGKLVGITQEDLEFYFANEIKNIAEQKKISQQDFLAKIKLWYNGYTWDLENTLYNPFSLLQFFSHKGKFQNYWFQTGTPNFLVTEFRKHHTYDIKNVSTTSSVLTSFDVKNLNLIGLLFQTGYLTLTNYDEDDDLYTLDYPNREVRHSLAQYLASSYREHNESVIPTVVDFRKALQTNDLDSAIEHINAIFATIPYDLWQRENEHFYHALIHLTFVLLGAYVQSEVHTSNGRCDALLHTADYIYAFEFKLDKTASEALAQIETKGYLTPFMSSTKPKFAVGINFSTELKRVESYLVKQM